MLISKKQDTNLFKFDLNFINTHTYIQIYMNKFNDW